MSYGQETRSNITLREKHIHQNVSTLREKTRKIPNYKYDRLYDAQAILQTGWFALTNPRTLIRKLDAVFWSKTLNFCTICYGNYETFEGRGSFSIFNA